MTQLPAIGVLIVDDHPLAQHALRTFLRAFSDLTCLGAVDTGEQALAFCEREEPDVVLMDLHIPGMGGLAATRALKELHPEVEIIALTSSEDGDLVREALHAKAIGYLVKTTTAIELANAIRAAKYGQPVLSKEAREALALNSWQVQEVTLASPS